MKKVIIDISYIDINLRVELISTLRPYISSFINEFKMIVNYNTKVQLILDDFGVFEFKEYK